MGDSQDSVFSLRAHRIPKAGDYQRISRSGSRVATDLLSMKSIPSPDGSVRLAFVVRRKSGCAVFRNRVRRVLRDVFFHVLPQVKEPRWAMVLFTGDVSHEACIRSEAQALLRKARWC